MAHMLKHSALGIALQLMFTGKISYSHELKDTEKGPDVRPRDSHLNVPLSNATESANIEAKSTIAESDRLVHWNGHSRSPRIPCHGSCVLT